MSGVRSSPVKFTEFKVRCDHRLRILGVSSLPLGSFALSRSNATCDSSESGVSGVDGFSMISLLRSPGWWTSGVGSETGLDHTMGCTSSY